MRKHILIVLLTIFSLTSGVAFGQTSSGEIRGRVADSADAVVVGAQVILTNQNTGETRSANTNSQGEFVFVALQPGTFSVSVKSQGFKTYEKRDLVLSASDRLSAGTLQLELGAVSETVSVAADVTPVQVDSAERSALLDRKEITSLTSMNRDPMQLLRVLPGVVKDDNGASNLGTQGAGTIAGVRESSNALNIDGVSGNPRGDGNKLDTPVNMDAVQEIKVVLNSYQAEYGGSAGAIVNVTTKSGTQDFHGAAYYYGRNEAFNANGWMNNHNGTPRGVYRYNTMGWNVGGPIYIPDRFNSRKDKLFFFFSQERWPTKSNSGMQRFYMPTAREKQGDFSQTYDYNGSKVYIRDPSKTGNCSATDQTACYPGNVIPASAINSDFQKIMNIFPTATIDCLPTGAGGKTPCPQKNGTSGDYYNYQIVAPKESPNNQTLLRVDYNISSHWKMYFRGFMNGPGGNSGLTSTTNKLNWGIPTYYHTPAKNGGINLTYIANSNLVNEFTVGYASWAEQQGFANSSDIDKLSKTSLGISLGQLNSAQNPLALVPRITGLSSGGSNGTFKLSSAPTIDFDNRFPMDNTTGTWEFTDGLTKIWGSHAFKVGIYNQEGRYIQRHIGSIFNGNFDVGANNGSPYDTNYAWSNLLTGDYNSYQEGSKVSNYAPHWKILEFYLQDTWKAKSNLTLNYGVRFTYDLPTELQAGYGAGFVPSTYDSTQVSALYNGVAYGNLNAAQKVLCQGNSRTTPTTCAQNPTNPSDVRPSSYIGTFITPFSFTGTVLNTNPNYPSSLRWSNGLLPAPRVGISWDPFKDGKTAVRLGGGLYYNTREGGGTVGDYSLIAPITVNTKTGAGQVVQGQAFNATAINSAPQDTRILQPHRGVESTLGVNLGVQRNVGFSTVVDIAYVGTFGRHLNQQINLNEVPYGGTVANLDMSNWTKGKYNSAYNCYGAGSSVNSTTGAVTGFCQRKTQSDNYVRPLQGYQAINLRDYGSTSNYNALQASVDHRFSKGLQFGAAYTWSKTLTYQDTVDGSIGTYQDRRFWDYGLASFDRPYNLVIHWSANIPNLSRLSNNRILKVIGDNWQWSGIGQFTAGAPGSIGMSGTPNYTYGGDGARAFNVGPMYSSKSHLHTTGQWLNPTSFAAPCAYGLTGALIASSGCVPVTYTSTVVGGTTYQYWVPTPSDQGLVRNTTFRVPGTNNWDMALQKDIPVKERMRFSIRGEAYNVFNHVSFDQVGDSSNAATLDYDYSTTGNGALKSTSTFGQVAGERGARILQLSGRFSF
jgi:hypothetical protein